MATCNFPVAVMSFNRPDLLEMVLKSLRNQTISVDPRKVHLFQDGVRSRFNENWVSDIVQQECLTKFKEAFPEGQVHYSEVNLGVALNFERAESLFFEKEKVECAFFFEDDLILSPYYIEALSQIADFALNEPLVSYVAAYGDHFATLEEQHKKVKKIIPLRHQWGFALTRRQWLRQKSLVEEYLHIVKLTEYSKRDHLAIFNLFEKYGYNCSASSQDAAKTVAGMIQGVARIMTFACYGQYIGKQGQHFTEAAFYAGGYHETEMFDLPPPQFEFPTSDSLRMQIYQDRELWRLKVDEFKPPIRDFKILFVEALYKSVLGRMPDKAGLQTWINALENGKPPEDVVRAFIECTESKYTSRVNTDERTKNGHA